VPIKETQVKVAAYALQLGAGIGVTIATSGTRLLSYLAGTAAFLGVGIALDPQIHADIKEGDWTSFLDHSTYHLPLVGAGHHAWGAWDEGHYGEVVWHAGNAALQVTSLKADAKLGLAKGRKVHAISPALKFSEHAIRRMAERGITPRMVRVAINKGLKLYDPLNKSINYILPNSFSSGKHLLIGTDPFTGEVRTVLRSSKNLIKTRMTPVNLS